MVYNWLKDARSWVLPSVCVLCGDRGQGGFDLCPGCYDDLPDTATACYRCARPLARRGLCGRCQRRPPAFDRTLAAFVYQDPVAYLVHGFKFQQRLSWGRLLGELTAGRVAPQVVTPTAIVPVPLHPARHRQRGYNQALELARPIARQLQVPVVDALRRIRATAPQAELPASQRRRNVRAAFKVLPGMVAARVALVDDVMTTGHTLEACANVLKSAGVGHVEVWVCARADRRS